MTDYGERRRRREAERAATDAVADTPVSGTPSRRTRRTQPQPQAPAAPSSSGSRYGYGQRGGAAPARGADPSWVGPADPGPTRPAQPAAFGQPAGHGGASSRSTQGGGAPGGFGGPTGSSQGGFAGPNPAATQFPGSRPAAGQRGPGAPVGPSAPAGAGGRAVGGRPSGPTGGAGLPGGANLGGGPGAGGFGTGAASGFAGAAQGAGYAPAGGTPVGSRPTGAMRSGGPAFTERIADAPSSGRATPDPGAVSGPGGRAWGGHPGAAPGGSAAAEAPSFAPGGRVRPDSVEPARPGNWGDSGGNVGGSIPPSAAAPSRLRSVGSSLAGASKSGGTPSWASTGVDLDDLESEDDLDDSAPKGKSYTWLHVIVLAVVAFVLGALIVLLLNKSSSGQTDALVEVMMWTAWPGAA